MKAHSFVMACLVAGLLKVWPAGAVCTVTVSGVSFGTYDAFLSTANDSTGTIDISCSSTNYVSIAIGPSGYGQGFSARKMKIMSGSDLMAYNLYTNGSRTTIWGDGSQGTTTVSASVKKQTPWNAPVYGRIPALQDIAAGQYGESLVVTVNY